MMDSALGKDRCDRDLKLRGSKRLHDIIMGVEFQQEGDRTQVAELGRSRLKQSADEACTKSFPSRRRCEISVPNQVDGSMGEGTQKEEACNVLVVGVDGTRGWLRKM